jgi:GNAT superfamily N-acetyltransferase
MQNTGVIARPMELNDIGDAMKLSTAEGWNQTEKDWELFIKNPGNICRVAEWYGKVIGTTTTINYNNQVTWIGMVLVDKAYRGHGISKLLLADIFKNLEHAELVKLDATPAGQQVYRKFDFRDEYLVDRMTNLSMTDLPRGDDSDLVTEPIQSKHIPEIIALDEIAFGANRVQLINYLVSEYPGKAALVKRNNVITGFALGRIGARYHHLGPVMASNPADAKILVANALKQLTHQPVVVDVLSDKEELVVWLRSMGFVKQRHFIRMYKKENPRPGVIANQYLIAGPEFG